MYFQNWYPWQVWYHLTPYLSWQHYWQYSLCCASHPVVILYLCLLKSPNPLCPLLPYCLYFLYFLRSLFLLFPFLTIFPLHLLELSPPLLMPSFPHFTLHLPHNVLTFIRKGSRFVGVLNHLTLPLKYPRWNYIILLCFPPPRTWIY